MHEREGPRKINTCPRIEKEEIVTIALNIPSSHNLSFENGPSNIFFFTNFIFENRLKTYAKGEYVQMLKYKGEFSLRENCMEGGFPIGIWRGHYEALCIENTLFFVLQTSTSSLGTAVLHLHTRAIWQIFLSFLWSIVFKKQSIEEFQCLIYALWMLYLLCNRNFLTPWFVA